MADVRPFRAVRYARPSAEVTAPPYDVLDEPQRLALRARDPHNVVHLTADPDEAAAGRRFRAWLAEGVLVRDGTSAVWLLEQDVPSLGGVASRRAGIAASLRVVPYSAGVVLPHERTHAGTRKRRLRLLRAARAQLEPIFLLYDAPSLLQRPLGDPTLEVEETRLWRLEGEAGTEAFFADRQLLIADGHHRYETAVAFAEEDGADRLLAVLVSTSDPGLEVFATHRVFTGRPDIDPPGESHSTVEAAIAALEERPDGEPFAVFARRGATRLVRGKDGELDVDLVDRLGHAGISYTPDRSEAVRRVESGEADCAFILRPPRVADVFERARRGRTMPQKATYFFPKLVSGLIIHPVDP